MSYIHTFDSYVPNNKKYEDSLFKCYVLPSYHFLIIYYEGTFVPS